MHYPWLDSRAAKLLRQGSSRVGGSYRSPAELRIAGLVSLVTSPHHVITNLQRHASEGLDITVVTSVAALSSSTKRMVVVEEGLDVTFGPLAASLVVVEGDVVGDAGAKLFQGHDGAAVETLVYENRSEALAACVVVT